MFAIATPALHSMFVKISIVNKKHVQDRKNLAKLQRVSGENKGKQAKGKKCGKKLDRKKFEKKTNIATP